MRSECERYLLYLSYRDWACLTLIPSLPHIALIFLYSIKHRGSKYCRFIQAYIQLLTKNSFILLTLLSSYWKFFRLTGNSFDLLEILSSYWKFFRLTGILWSYWKFFCPTGNSFVLLEILSSYWKFFRLTGILSSYWKFFRPTRNSFVLLEILSSYWKFFRLTGILSSYWKLMKQIDSFKHCSCHMCFFKDIKTTVWRTSSKQE